MSSFDAVVVGAGPNGLAGAAHLARSGRRVLVVEQADVIGGGTRTEELTLPGYLHDVCAAIHPLGISSPFFRELGLDVEWIHPEVPMSHPLPDGRPNAVLRDLDETAAQFGADARRYRRLLGPLVARADEVIEGFVGPIRPIPADLGSFVRFASRGALPASTIIGGFSDPGARAALAGMAAHATAPLGAPLTGGVALLFAVTAHAFGWPMARGGSATIASALVKVIESHGGVVETGRRVERLDEFEDVDLFLLDVMPDAAVAMVGDRRATSPRRRPAGPGVFKLDWALSDPIPWADERSPGAGTVHVGGTYEEVAAAERAVHAGEHPDEPFVLLAQQSQFDRTRAPEGGHTAWAYCHVPNGSTVDMTDAIERQVERFAPGFRDTIIATHSMHTEAMEAHNPNYVGGDIGGGRFGIGKALQFGAVKPYRFADGVYLCSSSTPPGAGVHGMCGYYAAEAALGDRADW